MATVAALPTNLRAKLDSLAGRIRRLRAVRGVALLVLIMTLTGGLALLADACFELPAVVRMAGQVAWFALGGFLLTFGVLVPLGRRIDPEALAALIEEKYPELGEQLSTTVEVAGSRDLGHGSRTLIDIMARDTE